MGFRGGFMCLLAMALALAALAAPALSAELTRAEYVDRAEAICASVTDKGAPILRKGFKELKANKVTSAGPKFVTVSELYTSLRQRLQEIPRPPDDDADLVAWLKQSKAQNSFLEQMGEALIAGRRVQAQGYLSRFIHSGNLANDLVLGFGFKSCLFNSRLR